LTKLIKDLFTEDVKMSVFLLERETTHIL